jgi:sugar fermentation stimulation protein A
MQYSSQLIPATLLRRYKRFLADVELADGSVITVHSPNTGSMQGCADPGMRVWIRDTENPKRKYRFAWELSETADGTLININTILTNHLVREGIERGVVTELQDYERIRSEVAYGVQRSRIDLLLERGEEQCYVEVKNVTARLRESTAIFPDAVTARGAKHLEELVHMVGQGQRAVIFFCVSRDDVSEVRPADAIDPHYGRVLRQALAQGVEALAYRLAVSGQGIELDCALPVVCP